LQTISSAESGVPLRRNVRLNLRERLFLRVYCYPPPGKPSNESDRREGELPSRPLGIFTDCFGQAFLDAIRDRSVLDIGCGDGDQVVGLALEGAKRAIGAEVRPIYGAMEQLAKTLGVGDRVVFTQSPVTDLAESSVDVVISQNSFEHFSQPDAILAAARHVLKPGGRFFITFAPPWLNPFGVHHFFMIRLPWAHFVFSEKTILTVRRLYRDDQAERYEDIEGGLNRMTIHRFRRYARESGLRTIALTATPIRHVPPVLSRVSGIQEFVTSRVSAILQK
jgi:SAM-dependent methyltransferase